MLLPVVAGSDKTTVSVATGHQEYHPVYLLPGNLSNTARRGHGNAVLPVAFLPIPKGICQAMAASNPDELIMNLISTKIGNLEARISEICAAAVSRLPCTNICTIEAWYDNARHYPLPQWPFPSGDIQHWTIHC